MDLERLRTSDLNLGSYYKSASENPDGEDAEGSRDRLKDIEQVVGFLRVR